MKKEELNEEWEVIKEAPDYQISTCGRVKTIKSGLIRKQSPEIYKRIQLSVNGDKKVFAVSRLVAKAFIPNPDNKTDVDHIDEDPGNNHKSNLQWLTHQENCQKSADARKAKAEAVANSIITNS